MVPWEQIEKFLDDGHEFQFSRLVMSDSLQPHGLEHGHELINSN